MQDQRAAGTVSEARPELSIWGRLVLIATMFVGRLSSLTLVLALAARADRPSYRHAPDTCKIG